MRLLKNLVNNSLIIYLLRRIIAQQRSIMAQQAQFAEVFARMEVAIAAIADKLAQAGMSASEEDALLAQAGGIATSLEGLAAPPPAP